jgi:hypothetical protein
MNDLFPHTVSQILAWLVVDHTEHPDLGPALLQLVEMPTATILIHIEMSDEGIEVQFHATTASGLFLLAQGVEAHRALSRQPMQVVMPREIGHLLEAQTTMLSRSLLSRILLG